MRKQTKILATFFSSIFLITALILSCSKTKQTQLLFLMYANGNNNLSDYISSDLDEAKIGLEKLEGANKKNIKVVALSSQKKEGTFLYDITGNGLKDISSSATFLPKDDSEANLNDWHNLAAFITWAKAHYRCKHIVLQMANHGGGPLKSPHPYLKAADIAKALNAANCTGANKLDMIILDECMGSSIEEAYEYADYADFLLASPINMPREGLNYKSVIANLAQSSSMEKAGALIIEDFKKAQQIGQDTWNIKAKVFRHSSDDIAFYFLSDVTALTLTNLSKLPDARKAIDSISDAILKCDTKTQQDIKQLCLESKTPFWCPGAVTDLFDIGYLSDKLIEYDKDGKSGLRIPAKKLQQSLSSAIVCAWRDGNSENDSLYYRCKESMNVSQKSILLGNYYGLTICGGTLKQSGNKVFPKTYGTELKFGVESSWNKLLSILFTT